MMLCTNPYVKSGHAFGCGQCMPCRVNRRRIWQHRIMLEACQYPENSFVTLTYDDEHLPSDMSLRPGDLQLFLKRLRKAEEPRKFRFFAVGEYGDDTERPHYHLALFDFATCARGRTVHRTNRFCCDRCALVRRIWQHGHVLLGRLELASAGYISGYVTKKMTSPDDERLNGRHPEFTRMSLRPGIGAGMMDEVAHTLLAYPLEDMEDVPDTLRHGSKKMPLGRYLRRRLRERIGRDVNAPLSVMEKMATEMQPLREIANSYAAPGFRQFAFKQEIIQAGETKRVQLSARQRIYKQRKHL